MIKTELTQRALERRVKKFLLKDHFSFFAGCSLGFESVLQQELSSVPELHIDSIFNGGIEFSGPIDLMYFVNYTSRVANRVLLRIDEFKVKSYPELFNKFKRISWELYLGNNPKLKFDVTAKSSRLHHTSNIESSASDAISEYFSQFELKIENSENATTTVYIRLFDDVCTVSIDTSGEHLHKRGYKKFSVEAPIRETIVSGLLLQSRKKESPVIIDPFCGSGTLLFEYLLSLIHVQPGAFRDFAFSEFPFFNSARWKRIQNIFSESIHDVPNQKFMGFDLDADAIKASRENQKSDSRFARVEFNVHDFFELKNSFGSEGLIISNPPYGKRIGGSFESMISFYEKIGKHLKNEFSGWDFLLVLAHPAYEKALGLKIGRELQFANGGVDVKAVWGKI